MIKAVEYIKTGFSADDAEKFNKALETFLRGDEKICVDFSGVKNFTTLFFNQTFARILVEVGPQKYSEVFQVENLSPVGRSTYQHSIENAKEYYKKTEDERKKHDTIIASDFDD